MKHKKIIIMTAIIAVLGIVGFLAVPRVKIFDEPIRVYSAESEEYMDVECDFRVVSAPLYYYIYGSVTVDGKTCPLNQTSKLIGLCHVDGGRLMGNLGYMRISDDKKTISLTLTCGGEISNWEGVC